MEGRRYFTCLKNHGIFVPLEVCFKSFARLNDPVFMRFRDMVHPALGPIEKKVLSHRPKPTTTILTMITPSSTTTTGGEGKKAVQETSIINSTSQAVVASS